MSTKIHTTIHWFWDSMSSTFVIRRLSMRRDEASTAPSAEDFGEQTEPLMNDKIDEEVGFHTRKPKSKSSRLIVFSFPLLAVVVFFSLLLGGLAVVGTQKTRNSTPLKHVHQTSNIMVKPCGSNTKEARAKGCHFDIISFNWLPDECYDAELSQDFDNANQLEWFLDPKRTMPLTHEQIMTGEYTGLYVNWEYHLRHCTAMWKKMHRAILGNLENRAIDSYIGVYEHTEHCEHMLLGGRDTAFDSINTRIAVKYPDCGI